MYIVMIYEKLLNPWNYLDSLVLILEGLSGLRRIIVAAIYGNTFSLFTLLFRIILVDFYIKC